MDLARARLTSALSGQKQIKAVELGVETWRARFGWQKVCFRAWMYGLLNGQLILKCGAQKFERVGGREAAQCVCRATNPVPTTSSCTTNTDTRITQIDWAQ